MAPEDYGRSRPMLSPTLYVGEAEQDFAMESSWKQVLTDIYRSPGYQLLFGPNVESPDGERSTSSPQSDNTTEPDQLLVGGDVALAAASSENLQAEAQVHVPDERMNHGSVPHFNPASQLSPYGPIARPVVNSVNANSNEPINTLQSGDAENLTPQVHRHSPASVAEDSSGDSPTPVGRTGRQKHRFALTEGSWNVSNAANGRDTTHSLRPSGKSSYVPARSSLLKPGPTKEIRCSDASGLVSPHVSFAGNLRGNGGSARRTTLLTPSGVPVSDPFVEGESIAASVGSAHWKGKAPSTTNPYGEAPQDESRTLSQPATGIPSCNALPKGVPTAAPVESTRPKAKAFPTTSPYGEGHQGSSHILSHPVTGIPTHTPVTLPPASFVNSLAAALPQLDAASRARLDAQKELRKRWIETRAKDLAAVANAAFAAKAQYEATGLAADHTAYIRAWVKYDEVWDRDRLSEERRNLTLPANMQAMRAGPGTLPQDAMGGKEGGVLGYRMAMMERTCAEAMEKDDKCAMDPKDLSVDEKKAVRKAVMKDIATGTEKRQSAKKGAMGPKGQDADERKAAQLQRLAKRKGQQMAKKDN